jgi:sterol 3beta-glucosyltransferase
MTVGDIWHDWLFPRMETVVHHGGAGTTAAALRAGTPSVIVPWTTDQPFWARRVEAAGLGIAVRRDKVSVDALADAIADAIERASGRRPAAEAMALEIAKENGVGGAIEILERARLAQAEW